MTDQDAVRAAVAELVAGEPKLSPKIDDAFKSDGSLKGRLSISTSFHRSVVQWALARHGLSSEATGTESVAVAPKGGETDLVRLGRAAKTLERAGIFFGGPLAYTSSDGWSQAEALAPDGTSDVLFWNHQSHDEAFDDLGDLSDELHMQWTGDAEQMATALRAEGLDVDVPKSEKKTMVVRHAGVPSSEEQAVATVTRLEDLVGRGWKESGRAERWFSWPPKSPHLRVSLGEGTALALEVGADDDTIEVEVDYGSRLDDVITAIDAARDELVPENIPEALAPIRAVAKSVSYVDSSGDWQDVD